MIPDRSEEGTAIELSSPEDLPDRVCMATVMKRHSVWCGRARAGNPRFTEERFRDRFLMIRSARSSAVRQAYDGFG
ncbi:MAG: hypothetical protein ACLRIL_09340 [Fusicatenibacter saccharivorans]